MLAYYDKFVVRLDAKLYRPLSVVGVGRQHAVQDERPDIRREVGRQGEV